MADERTPSIAWRFGAGGGVAAAFLVIDQLTKVAVRGAVGSGWTGSDLLPGIMRLQFVANTGAAFSFGEGHGLAFVVLAAAVVIGTAVYLARASQVSKVEVLGLGMVAGGAVGNAIDRLVFGYVTDFFATEFIDFPVFNVADIGITCGVAAAFIGFLLLSPANKVDATEELNRRDAERRARKGSRSEDGDRKGGR